MDRKKQDKATNIIKDVDMFAVSPTEVTGLFASAPTDNSEIEAYKEIFPFRADCGYVTHASDNDKKSDALSEKNDM